MGPGPIALPMGPGSIAEPCPEFSQWSKPVAPAEGEADLLEETGAHGSGRPSNALEGERVCTSGPPNEPGTRAEKTDTGDDNAQCVKALATPSGTIRGILPASSCHTTTRRNTSKPDEPRRPKVLGVGLGVPGPSTEI